MDSGIDAFYESERQRQDSYKAAKWLDLPNGQHTGRDYTHILPGSEWRKNLIPECVDAIESYFDQEKIAFHDQLANLLSSQAACINFFSAPGSDSDILTVWNNAVGPDRGIREVYVEELLEKADAHSEDQEGWRSFWRERYGL